MCIPPLGVRRYGRETFLVRSEVPARDHCYLVELPNPEHPFGQCDCKDHAIRITAPLNRGEEPERWTCKHQRRVLAILEGVLAAMEQNGVTGIRPADFIAWA